MAAIDIGELREHVDLEGEYVDFNKLRAKVSLSSLVDRLGLKVSGANEDGEVRTACPKCGKQNSLSLNVKSERFNCFAKGCSFRGGGVIDFFGKLEGVFAKEAAHLVAYLFAVEPYSGNSQGEKEAGNRETADRKGSREVVTREEFNKLDQRVRRLSEMVFAYLLDGKPEN